MREEPKFTADESVEKRIVMALRERYNLLYVEEMMKGADDETVLQNAEEEQRILLTADKDFGELVYYKQQNHAGIILYRLHGLAIEEKILLLQKTISKHGQELIGSFTVIQPNNIRIRKL